MKIICAGSPYSIGALAEAIACAIQRVSSGGPVALVAYSMGARIALQMLTEGQLNVAKVCLISATAGIEATAERQVRAVADDSIADQLLREGLEKFSKDWYQGRMWENLAAHPR